MENKIPVKERLAYALGDGAANIAWRNVMMFLTFFYTDVFGLTPATVAWLMLIIRFSDGVSDVAMGMIGDRTKSKYGRFRPWILWTAVPLGVILSLLFTSPNWSMEWKIAYAYTTYFLFTLVYTANNIPFGALMAVMTGDDKERATIGSYRMAGAFTGGLLVQGSLLYLVSLFGNINPEIQVTPVADSKYEVVVSAPQNVKNVNIKTKNSIALFQWSDASVSDSANTAATSKSFSMEANKHYSFIVSGESKLDASQISIINQKEGYSKAIYTLSIILILCFFITFYYTRERVAPPKDQKNDFKRDFLDLIRNKPWIILFLVGVLFNIYGMIKVGTVLYYFIHYINSDVLATFYMICLPLASIAGAVITARLIRYFGKKNLFIGSLLLSGLANALIYFCGPQNITAIFTLGIISECTAIIAPTLFFAMLGDIADYSVYVNGRRATGLIYSAGSLATKFSGGIGGAIVGLVLSFFKYKGDDPVAIQGAIPGIVMLMSWLPAIAAFAAAGVMTLYPLNQKKMDEITSELSIRRHETKNNL